MENKNQEINEIEEDNIPTEQNSSGGVKRPQKKPFVNNSGQNSPKVPRVIKEKFNWGAFLLGWIWGIGNKVYVTFWIIPSIFIPVLPLGLAIYFGIKGNEWAWQKKRYEGVRQFHEVQKKWAIAGVIVLIVMFLISLISTIATITAAMSAMGSMMGGMQSMSSAPQEFSVQGFSSVNGNNVQIEWGDGWNSTSSKSSFSVSNHQNKPKEEKVYSEAQIKVAQRQALFEINEAINRNYNINNSSNITYNSEGLTKFFSNGLRNGQVSNRSITTKKAKYTFYGYNNCENLNCYILVYANKDTQKRYPMNLRLQKNPNGSLSILESDRKQYMAF